MSWDVLVDGEPITRERLVSLLTVDLGDGPELDRERLKLVDDVAQFDRSAGFVDRGRACALGELLALFLAGTCVVSLREGVPS